MRIASRDATARILAVEPRSVARDDRRVRDVLRHLVAIVVFPVTMAALVPWWLLRDATPAAWPVPTVALVAGGGLLLAAGLVVLVTTIGLFARVGKGTLAPFDPPRHLVVAGVYRHVRNPMLSGVCFILLGEALLFASPALLGWFAIFTAIQLVYVRLVEEPGLERRFGEPYREYRRQVPAWIPRLRPWRGAPSAPGPTPHAID
jgi:protein-S-isoprenylcysteine O-methyltransferase Ste14